VLHPQIHVKGKKVLVRIDRREMKPAGGGFERPLAGKEGGEGRGTEALEIHVGVEEITVTHRQRFAGQLGMNGPGRIADARLKGF
jgi:hypothetical protein